MNKGADLPKQPNEGVIIDFPWGMPGLEYKQYLLISFKEDIPYYFLQCIEEPQIGLLLINPFSIYKDYEFELDDETAQMLEISKQNEVAVFCTVNTSRGIDSATVNLLAPIIINTVRRIGKQKVLTEQHYSLYEPLKILTPANEGGR